MINFFNENESLLFIFGGFFLVVCGLLYCNICLDSKGNLKNEGKNKSFAFLKFNYENIKKIDNIKLDMKENIFDDDFFKNDDIFDDKYKIKNMKFRKNENLIYLKKFEDDKSFSKILNLKFYNKWNIVWEDYYKSNDKEYYEFYNNLHKNSTSKNQYSLKDFCDYFNEFFF